MSCCVYLVLGVCIYCYFGDLALKKKQNRTQIHPHPHNLQTNKFKEENRHHPRCVFKASVCKSSINLSSKFWQQVISHQRCYEGRRIASKNKSLMTWGVLLCNSRARGVPGIQWHLRKRWQRCLLLHQTATTHSTEPPSAIFSHLWPLFFFNMLWVGHFHVSNVQMSPMQAPRQVQHWPTPEQCIPWRGSKAALLLSCSSCQLPQPVLLPWLLLGNKEKNHISMVNFIHTDCRSQTEATGSYGSHFRRSQAFRTRSYSKCIAITPTLLFDPGVYLHLQRTKREFISSFKATSPKCCLSLLAVLTVIWRPSWTIPLTGTISDLRSKDLNVIYRK